VSRAPAIPPPPVDVSGVLEALALAYRKPYLLPDRLAAMLADGS
jgi:hypothetical protein